MRRYRNDLTAERVRELFELRDGALYWRVGRRGVNAGYRAGCPLGKYRTIRIDGSQYYEHRLIYLHAHGEWPAAYVDHRHGAEMGNCPTNLRSATASQNSANTGVSKNNKVGLKGVSWSKVAGKWRADIQVNRKRIWLGNFDCPAAAHFAYVVAADKHFGEFARSA